MIGMFKICDFCGAKEEKNFDNWGTLVMDGSTVKTGHSSMDLCENCMSEVVENFRRLYAEKRSGVVQSLPLFRDIETPSTEEPKRSSSKRKSKTTKKPT